MGKILYVPMLTYGHFSTCLNIGRLLIEKYPEHEVYFLVSDKWAKDLNEWEPKFKSLIYMKEMDTWKKSIELRNKKLKEQGKENEIKDFDSDNVLANVINEAGDQWSRPYIEHLDSFPRLYQNFLETFYEKRSIIEELVDELNPNVVAFDHIIMVPYLLKRKWIQIMTINPLFMDHIDLPPYSSGLSSKKQVFLEDWKQFRHVQVKSFNETQLNINLKLVEEGQKCVCPPNRIVESPYFNIYIYPKEVDYYSQSEKIQLPGKWLRLDSSFLPSQKFEFFDLADREGRFKRLKQLFKVPDDFLKANSKIIFFSMGSMASAYKKLMNRILNFISNLPDYIFIVSKGPSGNEIDLPKNCVGENFVNQFEILKICDLMISHGGNNTFCEAFHMGVKLILLPLFSDQPDNAQRLKDTSMGYAMNPFTCTQEEFTRTINEAINNDDLSEKMQQISKRIRNDNGMNRVVEELHKLIIS